MDEIAVSLTQTNIFRYPEVGYFPLSRSGIFFFYRNKSHIRRRWSPWIVCSVRPCSMYATSVCMTSLLNCSIPKSNWLASIHINLVYWSVDPERYTIVSIVRDVCNNCYTYILCNFQFKTIKSFKTYYRSKVINISLNFTCKKFPHLIVH